MGDKVLMDVSSKFVEWCLCNWSVGCFGGDEFVVICFGVYVKVFENYVCELMCYFKCVEVVEGVFVFVSVGWVLSLLEMILDSFMLVVDVMMYLEKEYYKVQCYCEFSWSVVIELV